MRTSAFLGAVRFSAHCLRALVQMGQPPEVVYALHPALRERHSDFEDLGAVAGGLGIEWVHLRSIREVGSLTPLPPVDLLWVLGWSEILPSEMLKAPRLGCIGSHPSLLPHGRGRHPIIHAILQGWPETGLTLFWLDEGVDTGDIAAQVRIPLAEDEDAESLYGKVEMAAVDLLGALLHGPTPPPRSPQAGPASPPLPRRHPGDERIDWSQPVLRQIRALTHPYLGARMRWDGQEIIVWKARPMEGPWGGRDHVFATAEGWIEITEFQAA